MKEGSSRLMLTLQLLFLITISMSARAQTDTITNTESPQIAVAVADSGYSANEIDSLRASASIVSGKIRDLESYYQRWNDQFPSGMLQYSYAAPEQQLIDIPRKHQREDWKFYLLLGLLILLALIRFGYVKEFEELFTTFRNWGPSQQMFRELGTGVSFGTVLLNIFSVLVLSLFVYLLLSRYEQMMVEPQWLMMPISLATVSMFLLARYTLLKAAALLFPFGKEITLYNFYEIQINRLLGVAIFPLVLLISFAIFPVSEYALYAALLMVIIFILIRYLKGFNIGVNYFGRHLFHFLLYICALEIAPVLIIIRLLQNLGPLRFSF